VSLGFGAGCKRERISVSLLLPYFQVDTLTGRGDLLAKRYAAYMLILLKPWNVTDLPSSLSFKTLGEFARAIEPYPSLSQEKNEDIQVAPKRQAKRQVVSTTQPPSLNLLKVAQAT